MSRSTERSMGRDRGQLLIVGALVIAVVLVSIVLVLNGTMYVENVDGGSQAAAAATDAATVRNSVGQDLDRLTTFTADGEGYVGYDHLDDETSALSGTYSRFAAGGGPASISVVVNESASRNVTRVLHDDPSVPLADDELITKDEANASGGQVVDFDLNFTVGDSLDDDGSDTFGIVMTDPDTSGPGQDATWRLDIYEGSQTGSVVFRSSPATYENGRKNKTRIDLTLGDDVHVDIDDGVVHSGGQSWEIGYPVGVSPPSAIEIVRGDEIDEGSYDLVFDRHVPGIESRFGPGEPSVVNATSSVVYDLRYRSTGLEYETRVPATVPPRRVSLLVEDFEGNYTGWSQEGGSGFAGVRNDSEAGSPTNAPIAHSGEHANYIEGPGDTTWQYDRPLDASEFDSVTVSFWAQAGQPGVNGPEANQPDEHLVVQFWNGTDWELAGNTTFDPSAQSYSFELGENATHDAFKFRFKRFSATSVDPWYIDDVVVYGVNES